MSRKTKAPVHIGSLECDARVKHIEEFLAKKGYVLRTGWPDVPRTTGCRPEGDIGPDLDPPVDRWLDDGGAP